MNHSACVDHVHFACVSFYHLHDPWPWTPPSPSPVPHTIARACMFEGAPKVLDAGLAFLVPFVLVLSSCRLPPRHTHTWPAQQRLRGRNASYYTISESSIRYDHSWVWLAARLEISPEVSALFPRALDVPSALSIDREHWPEGMPGVAIKWCRPAKTSFSRAPHGHLHVNRVGFCVTAPNPIWRLIRKRR